MNVIDLEILIPASPEFIWRFMGDLSAIPQWYEEVVSVSFLSTQREGRGTRWRHSTVKGNDIIVEISAWYDTLGYEYRIVDGTKFVDNQGRIRLQEVTDGTLVRWTFQYEPGGMLGGIRNAMRLKRSTTNQIQDSLRNLHHLIMQESGGISTHEAKASMQSAPDVSERLSYQPRHPSSFQDSAEDDIVEDDTTLSERFPLSYDLELEPDPLPQLDETDTKPNPVVLGAGDELIPDQAPDPELDDTRPVEVESLLAEVSLPEIPDPPPAAETIIAEQPEPEPIISEQPAPESIADREPSVAAAEAKPPDDSSQLSVFEIFGLQKPSEARAETDAPPGDFQSEAQRPDFRQRAPINPGRNGLAESREAPKESTKADVPCPGRAPISGWRRRARRNKTLLRTHT